LDKAHELITLKTIEAIAKIPLIKPLMPNRPIVVRKELVERGIIKTGDGVTLIDGRTTEISGDSLEEIFFRI
jgi:hypothetical protein